MGLWVCECDRQGGDDSNLILLYAASHQWNTMPSLKVLFSFHHHHRSSLNSSISYYWLYKKIWESSYNNRHSLQTNYLFFCLFFLVELQFHVFLLVNVHAHVFTWFCKKTFLKFKYNSIQCLSFFQTSNSFFFSFQFSANFSFTCFLTYACKAAITALISQKITNNCFFNHE